MYTRLSASTGLSTPRSVRDTSPGPKKQHTQNLGIDRTELETLKQSLLKPETSGNKTYAKSRLGKLFGPITSLLALSCLPTANAACTDSTVTHDGTTHFFTGAVIEDMLAAKMPSTTCATKFHDDLMATFPGYNQAYMAVTTSSTFENYCVPESTLPQKMAAAFNTLFSMGSGSDQTTAATVLPTHSLLPPYDGATSHCSPASSSQYATHCSSQRDLPGAKATLLGVNATDVQRQVCADTAFTTNGVCLQAETVDPPTHPPTHPPTEPPSNTTNPPNGSTSTPAPTPAPDSYTWMDWAQFAGTAVVTGAVLSGVGYCIYNACQPNKNKHLETLGLRDEDVTPAIQEAVNGIPSARIINNEILMVALSSRISTFAAESVVIEDPETLAPIIDRIIKETYQDRDDAGKALLHKALMTCYQNYRVSEDAQNSFDPGDIKRECLSLLFNNDSDQFKREIVTSLWALTAKKRLFDAHIGLKPEDLSIKERFIQNQELLSVDTESKLGQKRTTTIPNWVLDDRENSADVLTTHILKAFDLTGSTQTTERTSLKETINTALINITKSTKRVLSEADLPHTDQDVMFTIITSPNTEPIEVVVDDSRVRHHGRRELRQSADLFGGLGHEFSRQPLGRSHEEEEKSRFPVERDSMRGHPSPNASSKGSRTGSASKVPMPSDIEMGPLSTRSVALKVGSTAQKIGRDGNESDSE